MAKKKEDMFDSCREARFCGVGLLVLGRSTLISLLQITGVSIQTYVSSQNCNPRKNRTNKCARLKLHFQQKHF